MITLSKAEPRRISILGSTGSIGTQTLQVISEHPHMFEVVALTAGHQVETLVAQCRKFRPRFAAIAAPEHYAQLKRELSPLGIEVGCGSEAIAWAAQLDYADMVVTATVGYSGLEPTIQAIRAGKDIALANKETLVVAGALIRDMLQSSPSRIYPVDSEHSAIYQCLAGEDSASVQKLVITASGGPFRTFDRDKLERVSVEDALRHPNWSMGAKITVDSATMLNKAFEIIEARWLFDIPADRIEAIVHPQSIVHSMVQFTDGALKAQLGTPDMKLPIRYALVQGHRIHSQTQSELTLPMYANLTFEQPDTFRFPGVTLGHYALRHGGTTACVINAANEVAVAHFLHGDLRFLDIYSVIVETLARVEYLAQPVYADFVEVNLKARAVAEQLCTSMKI